MQNVQLYEPVECSVVVGILNNTCYPTEKLLDPTIFGGKYIFNNKLFKANLDIQKNVLQNNPQ